MPSKMAARRLLTLVALLPLLLPPAETVDVAPDAWLPPHHHHRYCPRAILALGDSTTDTGNAVRSPQKAIFAAAERPPYGMTYFGRPSGRFSDGRVMADIVSQAMGLGLLPPHLLRGTTNTTQKNFAVAGATALSEQDLQRLANGATSITPFNLGAQVSQLLASIANASYYPGILAFVGEIGGNDYNYAYLHGAQPHYVMARLVPAVVSEVHLQLDRLLSGAKHSGLHHMVVLGQFPMGCVALYQAQAGANATRDAHGCVAAISAVTELHDTLLRLAVEDLRLRHPDVGIVFFDVGAAFLDVIDHAAGYGFDDTVRPCYAGGLAALLPPSGGATAPVAGPPRSREPSADVCKDPSAFVNWDGVHFTDAMHRALVVQFLYGGPRYAHPFPNFLSSCV